jgi:hypothetical protein
MFKVEFRFRGNAVYSEGERWESMKTKMGRDSFKRHVGAWAILIVG